MTSAHRTDPSGHARSDRACEGRDVPRASSTPSVAGSASAPGGNGTLALTGRGSGGSWSTRTGTVTLMAGKYSARVMFVQECAS